MTHGRQVFWALAITAVLVLFGIASELGAFRHDGAPLHARLRQTDIRVTGAVETTIIEARVSCRVISRSDKRFFADTYRDGEVHLRLQVSKEGTGVRALFWGPDLFQNTAGTGVTVDTESRTVTLDDAPFTAPAGRGTVHITGTYHCGGYDRR